MRTQDTNLLQEAYEKVLVKNTVEESDDSTKFTGRTERLDQAIDYVAAQVRKAGIIPAENWAEKYAYDGIPYGQKKKFILKSKPSKARRPKNMVM